MGVIFGTGCNAAYMEKCGSIPKIKEKGLPDDMDMASMLHLSHLTLVCIADILGA